MISISTKSNYNHFFERSKSISIYFDEVRKTRVLTQEEERNLLYRYKHAKKEEDKIIARDKLVKANLRFVVSIARKLSNERSLLDSINEGNLGLMKAIDMYDLSQNTRLITYAVAWIISYIQHFQYAVNPTVTLPNIIKVRNYVNNATKQFFLENEREPYPEEVAELVRKRFKFKIPRLEDVTMGSTTSIDEKLKWSDDDEHSYADTHAFNSKTARNNVEEDMEKDELKKNIEKLLSTLTDREQYIVKHVHGIDCLEQGWATIGDDLDLCGERVRQLYNDAIIKLQCQINQNKINYGK